MNEYKEYWKRFTDFNGVATRRQYWMSVLFNFIFLLIFTMILVIGMVSENNIILSIGFGLLMLFVIATFIPTLSITIRRFHDTGRNATMIIIYYIASFIEGFISGSMGDTSNTAIVANIILFVIALYVCIVTIFPSKDNKTPYKSF